MHGYLLTASVDSASASSDDVSFVTGTSKSESAVPIIGPPMIIFFAPLTSAPHASNSDLTGVPTRTTKFLGDRTPAPVTVTTRR